jgi:tRNA U34 5-carboxymethylaminomethyl modifying GTPase MnmE/TrmE
MFNLVEFSVFCYDSSTAGFFKDFKDDVEDCDNILSDAMDFLIQQNIKVLLVGSSCVGKSSVLKKLQNKNYRPISYFATDSYSTTTIRRGPFNFVFTELAGRCMVFFPGIEKLISDTDIIVYLSDSTRLSFQCVKNFNSRKNKINKPTLYVRNKKEYPPLYSTSEIEHSISVKNSEGVEEFLGKIAEKIL